MRQSITTGGDTTHRWGSLTDMPEDVYAQASAVLRRAALGHNVPVILPYISTKTGERRVWRFGGGDQPARRHGVAIRLSDVGPGGGAA